jgi:hypothetical protein
MEKETLLYDDINRQQEMLAHIMSTSDQCMDIELDEDVILNDKYSLYSFCLIILHIYNFITLFVVKWICLRTFKNLRILVMSWKQFKQFYLIFQIQLIFLLQPHQNHSITLHNV